MSEVVEFIAIWTVVVFGVALFLWGRYVGYWQGVEDADKNRAASHQEPEKTG